MEAIAAQRKSDPSPAFARQLAADRARSEYGLKSCFDTGEKCRCAGTDNQKARVSMEICQMVPSEPQLFKQ